LKNKIEVTSNAKKSENCINYCCEIWIWVYFINLCVGCECIWCLIDRYMSVEQ